MNAEHSMEEPTSVTTEHISMEGIATEKGKGKAIQEQTSGEEDSSDDDDGMAEETVRYPIYISSIIENLLTKFDLG